MHTMTLYHAIRTVWHSTAQETPPMYTHIDWDIDTLADTAPDDLDSITAELFEQSKLYGYALSWSELEEEAQRVSDLMINEPEHMPTVYIPGYGWSSV